MSLIVWCVVISMFSVGIAGVVLPVLPGHGLILAGIILHKVMLDSLSWWIVGLVALLAVAGFLVDLLAGAAGARWFGSSRWGVIGAMAGFFIGIFFGLPGMVIGPVAGALLLEMLVARKNPRDSLKAGGGAILGMAAATAINLVLAVLMIGLFFLGVMID